MPKGTLSEKKTIEDLKKAFPDEFDFLIGGDGKLNFAGNLAAEALELRKLKRHIATGIMLVVKKDEKAFLAISPIHAHPIGTAKVLKESMSKKLNEVGIHIPNLKIKMI